MKPISIFFATIFAVAAGNAFGQPTIIKEPAPQSVSLGANVTFEVTAADTGTTTYQWQFNEIDLSGATNRALLLTNVQPSAAGGYSVILSKAAGAISSAVAKLEVDATFTKITT